MFCNEIVSTVDIQHLNSKDTERQRDPCDSFVHSAGVQSSGYAFGIREAPEMVSSPQELTDGLVDRRVASPQRCAFVAV